MSENTGGTPYIQSTLPGANELLQPSANELEIASFGESAWRTSPARL